MAKQISKKYDEFWNNKELDIKSNEVDNEEDKKTKKKTTMARKKVETVIKEDVVITHSPLAESITVIPKSEPTLVIKTLKEIYEQYGVDGKPYKIYLRGQVIFDSVNHKNKPIFFDDYFILFGNKYIYKGIRFEKY
jgi:hypothetical protein